jgi:hypothetical protein
MKNLNENNPIIRRKKGLSTEDLRVDVDVLSSSLAQNAKDMQDREINLMYPPSPLVGAKGDGVTDDTLAIQTIIDSISVNYPNATLLFPKGHTFIVGTKDINGTFLYLKPNVNLDGLGTIKVKNGSGDFRSVIEQSGASSNISIKNITIDSNTVNNPLTAAPINNNNIIRTEIFLINGDNYLIENVTIKNSVGVWSIITNQVTNTIIRNCKGVNIGNTTFEYDTSFIYSDGDNATIENNHIVATGKGVSTAIEVHRSNKQVRNNIIEGFRTGILYASEYGVADNIHIENNILKNVTAGVNVWATEHPIKNIHIKGNDVYVDNLYHAQYGADGITVTDISTNLIDGMFIKDNTIIFDGTINYLPRNGVYNGGITILTPNIKNIFIENNLIKNPPQCGIGFNVPQTIENLLVSRNTIINAGKSATDNYRFGIVFFDPQYYVNTKVDNNIIQDNRETKVTEVAIVFLSTHSGVDNASTELKVIHNEITTGLSRYSLGTSPVIEETEYRTVAGSPISVTTPYRIGEEILDITNKNWYKATGKTSADWKLIS